MKETKKILSSIRTLEMEEEEEDFIEEEVSEQFDFNELVESIGEEDFEFVYLSVINNIRETIVDKQQILCFSILSKIKEVYDYEFLPYIDIENQQDFDEIYELISFIEFNNVSFNSDVWKFLDQNLRKINISEFCKTNYKKVIKEIEEQVEIHNLGQITKIFLRTYYKDDIINWFIEVSEKSKMFIILRILEGENND